MGAPSHGDKSKGGGPPRKKSKPISTSTDSGVVTDNSYDSKDSPKKAVSPKKASPKKAAKKAVSRKTKTPTKKQKLKSLTTTTSTASKVRTAKYFCSPTWSLYTSTIGGYNI